MAARRDFNFLVEGERPSLAAWLLLLAGIAVLAVAADDYEHVVADNEQLGHQVERLKRKAKVVAPTGVGRRGADKCRPSDARSSDARPDCAENAKSPAGMGVPSAAAFPWDIVLREIEFAADARIAMLGVETDAPQRRTRIAAEVRNIDDALAFAARLRESPMVREAFLLSHEAKKGTPVPVLAVTLQVDWRND